MKLHLPQGLRTALLTCISGLAAIGTTVGTGATLAALVAQASAEEEVPSTTPTPNGWHNYALQGGAYNMSNAQSNESILFDDGAGTMLTLYVAPDGNVSVAKIDSMSENSSHDFDYTKTGAGSLTLLEAPSKSGPQNIYVNNGTLKVAFNNGSTGFALNNVEVSYGATLQLAANDALGWGDTGTKLITLTGKAAEGETPAQYATLQLEGRQTMSTSINLNGYTRITDGSDSTAGNRGSLNPYGGTITVTGTDNVISAGISLRENLTVDIAENAELDITGKIWQRADQDGEAGTMTKTGVGTLTFDTIAEGAQYDSNDGAASTWWGSVGTYETLKGLDIQGGEVVINRDMSIGALSAASGTTLNNTAVLTLTGASTVSGALVNTGSLIISNTAVLTLTSTSTGSGSISLSGGTLNVGEGKIVSQGITVLADSVISGAAGDGAAHTGLAGAISGTAGNLTINSAASTASDNGSHGDFFALSADVNLGSKDLIIGSGVVRLGSTDEETASAAYAFTAGNIVVKSGATLEIMRDGGTLNSGMKLEGGTLRVQQVYADGSGDLNIGTLTVTAASTIDRNNWGKSVAFSSLTGAGDLALNNWGTTKIGALDAYTGNLSLNGGTLQFTEALAISSGKITVNGGTLSTSKLSLTGGELVFTSGSISISDSTSADRISLTGGKLTANADMTLRGNVTLGAVSLYSGENTITLGGEGTTTFVGTVTNNGNLVLGGTVAVQDGAIFTKSEEYTPSLDTNGFGAYRNYLVLQGTGANVLDVTGTTYNESAVLTDELGAYFNTNGTTYYVNEGTVTYNSIGSTPSYIVVQDNATLKMDDGTDLQVSLTLNSGHLQLAHTKSSNSNTVTLAGGTNTIFTEGSQASLVSDVSGTGDLVVTGASSDMNIFRTLDYTGDLILVAGSGENANKVVLHQAQTGWGANFTAAQVKNTGDVKIGDTTIGGQAASGADVVMQNGASIQNEGDVTVSTGGKLTMQSGSSINHSVVEAADKGSVTVSGGEMTVEGGASVNTKKLTVSAGSLSVAKDASFTATEFLMGGGTVTTGSALTLGKLEMSAGTLNLGGAITGLDGFTITQTGGSITLTEEVLAALDSTNVVGTSNGWGINKYALVVPSNGASLSLGSGVMVSVGEDQHELGTDGTLSIAATSGTNYYIVNGAETFYGTATTGIDTAKTIVLAGGGLNYNADAEADHDVAIDVQKTGVVSLNGENTVLEASRVTFAEGAVARLHGNGSYVMSGTVSADNLDLDDTNNGSSEWTGKIVMDNATLSGTNLDDYVSKQNGAATSSVELKNASGSLAAGTQVANVIVSETNTINASQGAVELAGKVSGTGELKLATADANYKFSGNVTEWTGTINGAAESGTPKVTFSAADAAQQNVNVALKGNMDVTFEGEGTKYVGNALSDYTGTTTLTGGDVVLTDPAAFGKSSVFVNNGVTLDLRQIGSLNVSALDFDANTTVVLGSEALDFSIGNAVLDFYGAEAGIATVESDLGAGFTTIDISSWNQSSLEDGTALFNGVDTGSWVDKTVYIDFGGETGKQLYDLTINEAGQVVTRSHEPGAIPEPTTATLSLLALAALAARRRRK